MSQVDYSTFPNYLSPDNVYAAVNQMAVDYLHFAQDTHYDARLYGVRVQIDKPVDVEDLFLVNRCLRESLRSTLFNICETTEKIVGYNLSPRYHREQIESDAVAAGTGTVGRHRRAGRAAGHFGRAGFRGSLAFPADRAGR